MIVERAGGPVEVGWYFFENFPNLNYLSFCLELNSWSRSMSTKIKSLGLEIIDDQNMAGVFLKMLDL